MSNICNQTFVGKYKVIMVLLCMVNIRFCVASYRKYEGENMKYILLWKAKRAFKNMFVEGQEIFTRNNCHFDNCFITSDWHKFGGNTKKFHAILFSGWDQNWYIKDDFPEKRYSHQKYAFVQSASAANAYVCHSGFDNFFNWTIIYELYSDIVFPEIQVKDMKGKVIGTEKDTYYSSDTSEATEAITDQASVENKTKSIVWLNSNENTSNVDLKYVEDLQKALEKYDLKIDIYEKSGPLNCSAEQCDKIISKYYFYLVLEDSIADDYVTDDLLKPIRYKTVPIVYGSTNYSRFLPPQSYLDATSQTPEALAASINSLIKNQTQYQQYFLWKSQYSFCLQQASSSLTLQDNNYCRQSICDLCESLHDPNKFKFHSSYSDFRKWWYPNYLEKCPNLRNLNSSSYTLNKEPNQFKKMLKDDIPRKSIFPLTILPKKSKNFTDVNSLRRSLYPFPGYPYYFNHPAFKRPQKYLSNYDFQSERQMKLILMDKASLMYQRPKGPELLKPGGGGSGGIICRNCAGWDPIGTAAGLGWAGELNQVYVSVASNNFLIE